jgi:sugar phosphate isomerase/epimerase
MQLGFVSAILHDLTLEQVLQFAAAEHFDCVELMSWPVGKAERKYAGVTHVDATQFSQAQADEVLALIQRYGVAISGLGYYPNLLDADAQAASAAREHLKKVIRAARRLNLSVVNTFLGADHHRKDEENFAKFLKVWPGLIRLAEEQGIRIGIENCPMFFTDDEWPSGKNLGHSPALWRRMFKAIPSRNFGLNYDPSHMVWQQMDWIKPLKEFARRLHHIHAKDVLILRDRLNDVGILATPLQYHLPRIPGFGEVDWGRFIGALKEVGYDGPVCIEVEDETFGRTLEGRKHALRVARNVLRPFIA